MINPIAAEGFKVSLFGTVGNVGMDVIEGQYESAFWRSAKFGASFGMGRAIEAGVPYSTLQYLMNAFKSFSETYVTPVIEDSWNKFNVRNNQLKL